MILPDRAREISVEIARPLIEYIDKARHSPAGVLDSESIRIHCEEFFSAGAANLAKCIIYEVAEFLSADDAVEWLDRTPDAAITLLAAHIHCHIILHGKELMERVNEPYVPSGGTTIPKSGKNS